MVFSDGECPACGATALHLNASDLYECPQCHLVCALTDGLVATVMPQRGNSNFRFEDCQVARFRGTAFAKSQSGTVLYDPATIFKTKGDLLEYFAQFANDSAQCIEGQALSEAFLAAFNTTILSSSKQDLLHAWSSRKKRTAFYTRHVMPRVAQQLGLEHGREEFHVDFVMSKVGMRAYSVPKIYIESENSYTDAGHEMRKLCSINAPLRVLITVTKKAITQDNTSPVHQQLRDWEAIVRSHHEENKDFRGVIAIIIGRHLGDTLEFIACAFRSTGDLLRPLSPLVSRDLTHGADPLCAVGGQS